MWRNSKIPNVVGQKMLGLLCFHCKGRLQLSPPRAASRTECPGGDGACPTGLGRARVALSLSAWLPGTLVPMAAMQAHPSFCAVVGFLSGALPVVVESCKNVKSLWRRCLSRQLERRKDFILVVVVVRLKAGKKISVSRK